MNERLIQRGLWLEYLTLGWNVVGTAIIMTAAIAAHSVALAGFGLDSMIEIGASSIVIWQLKGVGQSREKTALRLIALSFFALALYIVVQSGRSLLAHIRPEHSSLGIVWLSLTFIVMLLLARGKAITGAQLNNTVLQTEARVTVVDALLAFSVLCGLVLNTLFGWWWADSISALVIVFYGVKEGLHAWHEAE
jgi:divalent metal cation (Fe/Co/Zn/Cd) transporter